MEGPGSSSDLIFQAFEGPRSTGLLPRGERVPRGGPPAVGGDRGAARACQDGDRHLPPT